MPEPAPLRCVVILPTYNERENLAEIAPEILAAAPVDLMILDDNSPDGTGAIADRLVAGDSRIQVVHRATKRGLGAAYRDGFTRALAQGYDRIIEMDADFSHPPERLPDLIRLSNDADLVLGSRWIKGGGTRNWPWRRRLISRGGSFYARTILGVNIRDLTGGFKCFRRQVIESLDLDGITSTGYAFQIEVTYRALKRGFRVREMPIIFVEREEGTSKMSRRIVLEAVITVPRLRLGLGSGATRR